MSDQNYLGLGVVFKGIDDGLGKTLKDMRRGLGRTSAELDKLKESMDGFSAKEMERQIRTTSEKAASAAEGMISRVQKGASKFDDAFVHVPEVLDPISGGFKGLEKSMHSFGVQKDKIIANILWFNDTADSMADATKGPITGLNAMSDAATTTAGAVAGAVPKSSGSLFGKFAGGLSTIGRSAKDAGSSMKNMGSMFKGAMKFIGADMLSNTKPFRDFLVGDQNIPQYVKDWDRLRQSMTRTFSPEHVKDFTAANLQNLKVNGVSADQAQRMATGMNSYGMSLRQTTEVLPMMGQMVGVLGMNAETVSQMFGKSVKQLKMMPNQMASMVKKTQALGDAFGFVDMVENLPELVGYTTDAMNKLGGRTKQSAEQTTLSLVKLSGQYAKMGLDTKAAAAASGQFLNVQTEMQRSIKRMNAGMDPLNDNFFELAAELSRVGGMDFNQSQNFLNLKPEEMQNQLVNMYQKANAVSKQSGDRFEETVRGMFGDAAANAMVYGKDFVKAGQDATKAAAKIDPAQNWEKGIDAMRNTFDFTEKLKKSNEELLDVYKKFSYKQAYLKTLNDEVKALQAIQNEVVNLTWIGQGLVALDALKTGGFSTFVNMLGGDGSVLAKASVYLKELEGGIKSIFQLLGGAEFLAGLAGTLLGSLGALVTKIPGLFGGKSAEKAAKAGVFTRVGQAISKTFPKATTALKTAAKWGGRFLGVAGSAMAFAGDYMDAKDDFAKGNVGSGWATVAFGKTNADAGFTEVAKNVGGQALKWGGLGATIGSFIMPGLGTAMGAGIGAAVGGLGALIKQAISSDWFKAIGDALAPIWESVKKTAKDLFSSIGGNLAEAIGAAVSGIIPWLAKTFAKGWGSIFGGLGDVFMNILPQGAQDRIRAFFSYLEPVINKVSSLFSSLGDAVKSLFNSFSASNDSIVGKVFNRLLAGMGSSNTTVQASVPVSSPVSPPTQVAQTTPMQQEAPMRAAMGTAYQPQTSMPSSPGVTDGLIGAVLDMKTTLQKELQAIANRPVSVKLVGDAAKFFKAAELNSSENMGRAGEGGVIGGVNG